MLVRSLCCRYKRSNASSFRKAWKTHKHLKDGQDTLWVLLREEMRIKEGNTEPLT